MNNPYAGMELRAMHGGGSNWFLKETPWPTEEDILARDCGCSGCREQLEHLREPLPDTVPDKVRRLLEC